MVTVVPSGDPMRKRFANLTGSGGMESWRVVACALPRLAIACLQAEIRMHIYLITPKHTWGTYLGLGLGLLCVSLTLLKALLALPLHVLCFCLVL